MKINIFVENVYHFAKYAIIQHFKHIYIAKNIYAITNNVIIILRYNIATNVNVLLIHVIRKNKKILSIVKCIFV